MRRTVYQGLEYGFVAGLVLAIADVTASGAMDVEPLLPLRMFASVVWGEGALTTPAVAAMIVVGLFVHCALSAIFGCIYGLVAARFSDPGARTYGSHALSGLLFGAVLWFVNYQIVARVEYPWYLDAPLALQLAMHSIFFGLPLGFLFVEPEQTHFSRRSLDAPDQDRLPSCRALRRPLCPNAERSRG